MSPVEVKLIPLREISKGTVIPAGTVGDVQNPVVLEVTVKGDVCDPNIHAADTEPISLVPVMKTTVGKIVETP